MAWPPVETVDEMAGEAGWKDAVSGEQKRNPHDAYENGFQNGLEELP